MLCSNASIVSDIRLLPFLIIPLTHAVHCVESPHYYSAVLETLFMAHRHFHVNLASENIAKEIGYII